MDRSITAQPLVTCGIWPPREWRLSALVVTAGDYMTPGFDAPTHWPTVSEFVAESINALEPAKGSKSTRPRPGLTQFAACGNKVLTLLATTVGPAGTDGRIRFPTITTNEKEGDMPQPAIVTAKAVMQMIERQNYQCAISGRQLHSLT